MAIRAIITDFDGRSTKITTADVPGAFTYLKRRVERDVENGAQFGEIVSLNSDLEVTDYLWMTGRAG